MLKIEIQPTTHTKTSTLTTIDAQRFFKENKGKDLFPEKTARMKKLWDNVK